MCKSVFFQPLAFTFSLAEKVCFNLIYTRLNFIEFNFILKQRNEAYKRLSEAQATVTYMENKVKHYDDILSGILPDDTNPQKWTEDTKPKKH